MKKIFINIILFIFLFLLYIFSIYSIFKPIIFSKSLIFPYAITPFDIINLYPKTWYFIVRYFFISASFTFVIIYISTAKSFYRSNQTSLKSSNFLYTPKPNELSLKIGTFLDSNNNVQTIYIPEKGLFQNILITGTIGTGKTSSAMYPFTKQLINYASNNPKEKLGMLILDVKGNYINDVINFAKDARRENDLIIIDLSSNIKYNPLDKPHLSPIILANRLKTILTLFSGNSSESYWLDKAEQILSESIKFCRLYNNEYVTFTELHKLINSTSYYSEKLSIIKENFRNNFYSEKQAYELLTSIEFFEKEFFSLDNRTLSILRSEITRITNIFVSDYDITKTFCPKKSEINFHGFSDTLDNGKIVILNMNIAKYKNLSKIIASYLKLDFQTEVLSRLETNSTQKIRKSAFISDEYQEYVTSSDSDFYAQSREAKCINIVATQSYTSLLNTLKDDSALKVIIQNLINKLWFRTDDFFTIDLAQKQIGKEEKSKFSTTISENAKETNYNFLTNKLISNNTNISESYNSYTQTDFIYDTNFFSQELKTFEALSFISTGTNILKPQKLSLIPHFLSNQNSNTYNTNNKLYKFKETFQRRSNEKYTHSRKKQKRIKKY